MINPIFLSSFTFTPNFLILVVVISKNSNNPPTLKTNIQKIKHENQENTAQEHRDGPKDPQKHREREVEGTQA